MREILFRGKRKDNGEWVYGYYVGPVGIACDHEICDIDDPTGSRVDVDPSTVGQYTGLTDRNGKRIFEGDIVTFKRINALGYTTIRIGDVRYYDKLPIFYIMATTGDAWDWVDCDDIEVIGNIHDNPELLEVQGK